MSSKSKLRIPSEILYLFANLLISFAVAMVTCADLGVSKVVAPAYILSLKLDLLTFGQCEYIVQGIVMILFCFAMRGFRLRYLASFGTCLLYGAMLDAWRKLVPLFNPDITPPGSMPMPARIILFAVGMVLTSLAVAMFFKTYIPPQVIDFFVKGVSERYSLPLGRFKTACDISLLIIALIEFLIRFTGIAYLMNIGTSQINMINMFKPDFLFPIMHSTFRYLLF